MDILGDRCGADASRTPVAVGMLTPAVYNGPFRSKHEPIQYPLTARGD